MADITEISWTDSTLNPWIGCTKVSPGCDHCYAEALAARYGWACWGKHPRYRTSAANWDKPRAWNADGPRFLRLHGHFVLLLPTCSTTELPRNGALSYSRSSTPRASSIGRSSLKRPQNTAKMLPADWAYGYPNVWLGTTTEDEKHYRMRWPVLSKIPAARRFISYEPAGGQLGNLAITDTLPDWIICGGESGPGARIMTHNGPASCATNALLLASHFFTSNGEPTKAIRPSGPGLVKPTSAPTILRPTGRAARSSIGSFTGPSPEAHNPSRGTTHSDVSA